MKIIFFDIEGVLNSNKFKCNGTGEIIDKKNVDNLKYIVTETDAKLVLMSDWRALIYTEEKETNPKLKEFLEKIAAADLEIYGVTPSEAEIKGKYEDYGRCFEVRAYVDSNDVDTYVIIDDMDMDWYRVDMEEYWINTENATHGLTEENAKEAIRILNR